jgi:hypothetical protein
MTYLARYESSRSGGERGEFDLDVQSRLGAERRARGRRLGTIPTERALVRIFKDTANLSSCTYTAQSSLVLPASMYADPAAPVTSPACRSATICQCAPCMSTLEPEGTHRWVGLAMAADHPVSLPMSTQPAAAPRPLRTRGLRRLRVRCIVVGLAPASSSFFRVGRGDRR